MNTQNAIAQIRNNPHGDLPPAQPVGSTGNGPPTLIIKNGTNYELSVYLAGPTGRVLQFAPGGSDNLVLKR